MQGQNAQQQDFTDALQSGQQARGQPGASQPAATPYLPPRLTLNPGMQNLVNRYVNSEAPQPINQEQARQTVYPVGATRPQSPIPSEHGHRTVTAEQALAMEHGQVAMSLARSLITPVNQYIAGANSEGPLHTLSQHVLPTQPRNVRLHHALECGHGNCDPLSSFVFDCMSASPEMKNYRINQVVSRSKSHALVTVEPPGGGDAVNLDAWVAYPTAGLASDVDPEVDTAGARDVKVVRSKPPGQIFASPEALDNFVTRHMARRPAIVERLSAGVDIAADRKIWHGMGRNVWNVPFSQSPNLTYQVPGNPPFTMNHVYPPR
jgi:hypothetical protein